MSPHASGPRRFWSLARFLSLICFPYLADFYSGTGVSRGCKPSGGPQGQVGRLGAPGTSWSNRRTASCTIMKKLFIFWRRKHESPGSFSHLPVSRASTRLPTELGYDLRDKDFKKFPKAASVRDLEKVKEYLHTFSS